MKVNDKRSQKPISFAELLPGDVFEDYNAETVALMKLEDSKAIQLETGLFIVITNVHEPAFNKLEAEIIIHGNAQ